jgi:hypothetical protein
LIGIDTLIIGEHVQVQAHCEQSVRHLAGTLGNHELDAAANPSHLRMSIHFETRGGHLVFQSKTERASFVTIDASRAKQPQYCPFTVEQVIGGVLTGVKTKIHDAQPTTVAEITISRAGRSTRQEMMPAIR